MEAWPSRGRHPGTSRTDQAGSAKVAQTSGTIVLDHVTAQGPRAVTLVPDFHLVIVRADTLAADLPGAFGPLDPQGRRR